MAASTALVSPLTGCVVPLEDAPDPAFAGRMLGDGAAVEPLGGVIVAPCDGTIAQVHRAGHALTLITEEGAEILIHVGIDTVTLKGRGFHPAVVAGAKVVAGQELITFDVDAIARAAPCLQTMILVTNGDRFEVSACATGRVEAGKSRLFDLRRRAPTDDVAKPGAAAPSSVVGRASVAHAGGVHARPAAMIRQAARRFEATSVVRFGGREASTQSVVGLMGLGIGEGDTVDVVVSGTDSALNARALAAIVAALETRTEAEHAPALLSSVPSAPRLRATDGPGLAGIRAVPGVAIGRAVRLDAAEASVDVSGEGKKVEHARFQAALANVGAEIAEASREAEARRDADAHGIFSAHAAMLDDPDLLGDTTARIERDESAAFAFRSAIRAQASALRETGNPLLAGRAADLEDLERRMLRAMGIASAALPTLTAPSVVIADDLAPSDLGVLAREWLVGIATAKGGATSHVAILARSRGVPMLVALGRELDAVTDGAEVLLDADQGRLDPAPDTAAIARATEEMRRSRARRDAAGARAHEAARTRDGVAIEVAANVATAADTEDAVARGADSVGLLRTELLFEARQTAPDETEQRACYQAVLDALRGRTAIIRTLDVGNDKELAYLPLDPEPNPALGVRGIRIGLARPEILDAQLRALLGVRPLSRLRVMLPMIADAGEIVRVRRRIEELARELGIGSSELPEVGVMIEVPSAAVLADQLAEVADFFSIGTNDLTQYTLAMDRLNPALAAQCDGLHPGVLRLVRLTVEGARRHGKWVGVCGALASDLEAVPILVGLGVTELSVGAATIAEVKACVRGLDASACRREADAILALPSAAAIRARSRELWSSSRAEKGV